jgi:OmpA-OmpF porin, OOP family
MKTSVYRLLIGCLLVGLCVPFAAAQEKDVEGSRDHPLISRYPGSYISTYVQKEFDEFTLPLGKIVSDGEFTKSQHLEGKVTYIEYVAPQGRSVLEIFRNYQAALQQAGFETLFTCARDECMAPGVGHGSANLYNGGEDGESWNHAYGMRYLSAKLARPEGDAYVSLFVSEQSKGFGPGAKLFVIEMKPMQTGMITVNAASLANDINRTGHASVYGIYFDTGKADVKPESDATLVEIAKLLGQDAKLKLYVVGHTDNVGTLASNMDLSKRRGDAVVKVLTTKYHVAAARLSAQGDGPTAPVASNKTEEGRAKNRRVELVEQ